MLHAVLGRTLTMESKRPIHEPSSSHKRHSLEMDMLELVGGGETVAAVRGLISTELPKVVVNACALTGPDASPRPDNNRFTSQ